MSREEQGSVTSFQVYYWRRVVQFAPVPRNEKEIVLNGSQGGWKVAVSSCWQRKTLSW